MLELLNVAWGQRTSEIPELKIRPSDRFDTSKECSPFLVFEGSQSRLIHLVGLATIAILQDPWKGTLRYRTQLRGCRRVKKVVNQNPFERNGP